MIEETKTQAETQTKEKPGKSKKKIIIMIGAFIAVIAVLAVILVNRGKEKPLTAAELINLGEKYLLEMDYEQAIVAFEKLIEIEPKNERAYTGAAEAYIGIGQTEKAIDVLNRGLILLPDKDEIKIMFEQLTVTNAPPVAETHAETVLPDSTVNTNEDSVTDPSEAQNIIDTLNDEDYKKLSIFLSNFSEAYFDDFDVENYTDEQLIYYAIWHIYRNNQGNEIDYNFENNNLQDYNIEPENYYDARVSEKAVSKTISRYFDITVVHQSFKHDNFKYLYKDGYYYFSAADGAAITWSEVIELYDNNDGTFGVVTHEYSALDLERQYERRKYWIFDPETEEPWDDNTSHYAIIEPFTYEGKDTYKLLRWDSR